MSADSPVFDRHMLEALVCPLTKGSLRYDAERQQVVSNDTIGRNRKLQVISFGEDEQGEVYLLTTSTDGKGIHRLVRK